MKMLMRSTQQRQQLSRQQRQHQQQAVLCRHPVSAAAPRSSSSSPQPELSSSPSSHQQRQQQPPQHSRRQLLQLLTVGTAAGLAAAAALPAPAGAAAAAAAVSSSQALDEYIRLEDSNKLKDQKSLDNIRLKYGIRRGLDGRVQLRRKSGVWVSVRLDMEVPGAILLRDNKTSAIYALETDSLPQVDLSDDYVLFMMFADGGWEEDMTPIEFEEDGGKSTQLTMTEPEFHNVVGILKEPEDNDK